ncbi:MAG: hypothetical protein KC414_12105, partial [Romboutsia sp.]|nr:hypothetical protein [Romboutsia sp.]
MLYIRKLLSIINYPFRVYFILAVLLIIGIYCYIKMPMALFPNSTRPELHTNINFGTYTKENFFLTYGQYIEADFKKINIKNCSADKVSARYKEHSAHIETTFSWGDDAHLCLKEIEQKLNFYRPKWDDNINNNTRSYINANQTGFILGNFYSESLGHEVI